MTAPYKKAMRKRQVWVEPLFDEAKAWHGLERFRLRMPGTLRVDTAGEPTIRAIFRLVSALRRRSARLWCARGASRAANSLHESD